MGKYSARAILAPVAGMAALVGLADAAMASGFALKEQGAAGLGNAYAGATAAGQQDLSTIFFNPAGMTTLSGSRVEAVASYIMPKAEFSASRAVRVTGAAISGGNGGDGGEDALLPAFYAMYAMSPDLRLGVGVNAPWGLVTEYDSDWVGRYHALKSDLQTINISPSVAWRANDWLSVGGGLQIQRADAELSNAVDFGLILAPGLGGAFDGVGKLEGDDWGFGFTLGAMMQLQKATRVGVAYRSQVQHTLEGDATFTGVPGPLAGIFTNTKASAKLITPDMLSAGVHHQFNPQWAVLADVTWTNWSKFKELRVDFQNAVPDSVTPENWDDATFVSLGATYQPSEQMTVRGGVAFDQSPVPDQFRTPRIPDEDRLWLAFGIGYKITPAISLDASYTHIFVDDSTLNLASASSGTIVGTYDNAVDIFAAQLRWVF